MIPDRLKNGRATRVRRATAAAVAIVAAIIVGLPGAPAAADMPAASMPGVPVQTVDAFVALFGAHPGSRVVHAKGIICDGSFTASPAAAAISRAPHLQGATVPVVARLSDFAGLPSVASGSGVASPRGLSIKFMLPDGQSTDIVAHSYDGFPAATPEGFLAFLRAVAASGPDAPTPTSLDRLAAEQPAVRRFLDDPKPIPASYATESFFGVDAFRFTNAAGESRFGRYRILPVAGNSYLDAADAAGRAPDFLAAELAERLGRGPVSFRLMLQLAAEGDPITDATAAWPADRPQVELGTLTLRSMVADSETAQRSLFFTPLNLPGGIRPSGDPLLTARSRAYAESLARRSGPEGATP